MNAGAYNHEISNYFKSARLLDSSGNEKTYKKSDVKFGYRYSSFPENEILIEAIFKYPKGNPEIILKNKKIASTKRKTSQPLNFRTNDSIRAAKLQRWRRAHAMMTLVIMHISNRAWRRAEELWTQQRVLLPFPFLFGFCKVPQMFRG